MKFIYLSENFTVPFFLSQIGSLHAELNIYAYLWPKTLSCARNVPQHTYITFFYYKIIFVLKSKANNLL